MLRFVAATEVANAEGMNLSTPKESRLSGVLLGDLTMMVINRFMSNVNWDDIVSIYLSGLADEDDIALIQRAVKALMAGGVEFA